MKQRNSKRLMEHIALDEEESWKELCRFREQRDNRKTFKPMPIAECRLARSCENCIYNKGSAINEMNEFLDYGRSFYYGFLACTLEGRTPDKCRVTTREAVCKHHKFAEKGIGGKTLLHHLKHCIEERVNKNGETINSL